jgi:hypothetical protein
LLYTFCKIRGEKVIVLFFNAEAKNLELLLSAIETAYAKAPNENNDESISDKPAPVWSWEQRYIVLLWLSHLLLAPFDLATISSASTRDVEVPEIPRLTWPRNLPGVALRVVPLAISYLAHAGKERDAAKTLLVRISMRKDMQELGLLHALIQWASSCLHSSAVDPDQSPYYYIGILSYIGGVLVSSASTSDMDSYLMNIFSTVMEVSDPEYVIFKTIHTSALARKTIIKVLRTIAVLILRPKSNETEEATKIVEDTVGHMMEALGDNDTPVRLAASKALSIITLKLAPDMATQVVDAVLETLSQNVLWRPRMIEPLFDQNQQTATKRRFEHDGNNSGLTGQNADLQQNKIRDLSGVDPLAWHGLILTLSHLLYRQSPPATSLPNILHALLIGLSFEQRSTAGNSIGTNVRDAACFGIWALARRYSTEDLMRISVSSVRAAGSHNSSVSIIQVLATELVVSASLDPAGNIRRGASAGLQELIGRHENTVAAGIPIVQAVDYHAVALRSKAVLNVGPKAALLSEYYEDALIDALLDWRGIGDADPDCRRTAAAGVGLLSRG